MTLHILGATINTQQIVLADKVLGRVVARDSAFSEKVAAAAIWTAIKAKAKIGMNMKSKKTTTRKKEMKKRF